MSSFTTRIRQLERQLRPAPEVRYHVTLWLRLDDEPPEWAQEAIRPHCNGADVSVVEWSHCPATGELAAQVGGQRYKVTPDGCEPTEPAFTPNPFTLDLDNPNEAGPRSVNLVRPE